jgi:fermentation-respiration switch protein FrsA (DUF1100 family)
VLQLALATIVAASVALQSGTGQPPSAPAPTKPASTTPASTTPAPTTPAPATAAPTAVPAAERTPVGLWQGPIAAGNGSLFVRLEVAGSAKPEVMVTLPQAMAMRQAADDVALEGTKLGLTLNAAGIAGRFEGEVDESGAKYVGTLTLRGGTGEPISVPFSLGRTADAKATQPNTTWEGILDVGGTKLPFAITLADHPTFGPLGAIDIPIQGLDGFPLIVTKGEGGKLACAIPVGVQAVIEVAPKDDKLVGSLKQGGMDIPVEMTKRGAQAMAGMSRPQTPKAPFPYTTRDVTIPHRFGHTLAGTLSIPARPADAAQAPQQAKYPAVVMITGSGPQDRDETIFGHKPFAVIADALTRAGIAVLRFDDRGVGKSTGNFESATSYDFAADVDEATLWLRRQPEIDGARIGLIGHSEGGLIAPVVAKWQWTEGTPTEAIRFMVLLGGPGVSGRDLLLVQMRKLMAAEGATAEEMDAVQALQAAAMDAVIAEKTIEEITPIARVLVAKQLDVANAHAKPVPNADLEQLTRGAVAELTSLWMRSFMAHNPQQWIQELVVPVLAMQGGLDLQVDADQNLTAIEKAAAAGGVKLTAKRYEKLNHLFQPATKGSIDEYGTIETTFDPQALKDLVDWVVATTKDPAILTITPRPVAKDGSAPSLPQLRVRPDGPPPANGAVTPGAAPGGAPAASPKPDAPTTPGAK